MVNRLFAGAVADAIDRRAFVGVGFLMRFYGAAVTGDGVMDGTSARCSPRDVGCYMTCDVAGYACLLSGMSRRDVYGDFFGETIHERGRLALELTSAEADHLFADAANATEEEAIRHLRQIEIGGPIDWSTINPNYDKPFLARAA